MEELRSWHRTAWAERATSALEKNGIPAFYAKSRHEALEKILAMIPLSAVVGVAGSATAREIGLLDALRARKHELLDHNAPGLTREESLALRRRQLSCDVFITGTNAITLDGKLVNTDGIGNRVAAMIFGPQKVIVVAGINKLVRDVDAAMARIQQYAAPMNNKRFETGNPCLQAGECVDCRSPKRICNVTTIISRKPGATDLSVVLIGEILGF